MAPAIALGALIPTLGARSATIGAPVETLWALVVALGAPKYRACDPS